MKWWTQLTSANAPADFLTASAVALTVWVALALAARVSGRVLGHFASRTASKWYAILADTVRATSLLLMLPVALYAGASLLDAPVRLERFLGLAAVVALMLQAGLWINRFIGRWVAHKLDFSRQREPEGATALGLLAFAARAAVWSLVLLLMLDQLDFNITALVAGLGVGGVAVALAVQNVLGDLFASLSIVLDKPFVVGDFIVVDDLRGTIERVGIKTTRIRSLDGELLVFSNADLLRSRIRNFKSMHERRVLFTVGLTYQTPAEKLGVVAQWLREAVEARPRTRFDRAHFKEMGDFALVFEVVYYVLDADYNVYMDVHQEILHAIFERFAHEGVEFAYPTRTVRLIQEPAAGAA